MARELIIDSFAGGGGASTGIEMALGRSPDIAINHDAEAIAMHAINHPHTRHLNSNIWRVDPVEATGGQPVGLAWFSPDCKHFSKAKGGRPVSRNIRDLAWVVILWARRVRPRIIALENVEEFRTWGPITADGQPCKARQGHTFERWLAEFRRLGYRVEWRELRACDYGAPTIRKRLFLIARRDGKPIVWPEPTHGAPDSEEVKSGRRLPWRTAADIIDWSLPCPSIFLTKEEGRALGVNRPLAEATMARIAKGVVRYVLNAREPFIVTYAQQGGASRPASMPVHTITASPKDQNQIVVPHITGVAHGYSGGRREYPIDDPIGTVTGGGVCHAMTAATLTKFSENSIGYQPDEPLHTVMAGAPRHGVIACSMVQTGYGEREGQAPRALDPGKPLGTIVASGAKHAAVAAFLAQHNAGPRPGAPGRDMAEPVSTVTASGSQQALVSTFVTRQFGASIGSDTGDPVGTVTAGGGGKTAVVSAGLVSMKGSARRDRDVTAPLPTICAGGTHAAEVRAFLIKYYGNDAEGRRIDEPTGTVTTKDRFGLVMIDGQPYAIADIGMRMLTPRELFRAQGFPEGYIFSRGLAPDGTEINLTKTAQVRMCGNSVCPPVAAALIRANYSPVIPDGVRGLDNGPLFGGVAA